MDFSELPSSLMASSSGSSAVRPETAPVTMTTGQSQSQSQSQPVDNDVFNYDFNYNGNFQPQSQSQSQGLSPQSQKAQPLHTHTRVPTFKEFEETIKNLKQENFQLKLRLYLQEEANRGKNLHGHGGGVGNAREANPPASAASIELVREFQNLRQANESLQLKLSDSENRNRSLHKQIEEHLNDKEDLMSRNEVLVDKLDVLDRELSLLKLKKQEDEDIEQCVQAFHGDDGSYFSGKIHGPNTPQFLEFQRHLVEELEKEKESWKVERLSLEEKLAAWEESVRKHEEEIAKKDEAYQRKDEQFRTSLEALRDLGVLYKTEQKKTAKLEAKVEELRESITRQKELQANSEKLATVATSKQNAMSERLTMTRKIVDLLKARLMELAEFLQALLDMEKRGILVLTGLTPQNRQSLRVSLDQSQLLSETLVRSLAEDWNAEEQMEANKLKFSKLGLMQSELADNLKSAQENNNLKDAGDVQENSGTTGLGLALLPPFVKPSTAAKSIQCERDSEMSSGVSSQIDLLTTEKKKLEDTKNRLVTEKGMLYARVATLEANLNSIKELSYPLQVEQLQQQIEKRTAEKLKMEKQVHTKSKQVNEFEVENRKLFERLQVSESALKRLHHEHARLVSELRDLRNVCPVKENYEKIIKSSGVGVLTQENRQDSSPDLGIESGHDALSTVSSPIKPSTVEVKSTEEYKQLKSQNRELASKLKHTRLTLQKTLDKLNQAQADKEQFEKAVCRELHQTHSILKDAQVQLEVEVPIREGHR